MTEKTPDWDRLISEAFRRVREQELAEILSWEPIHKMIGRTVTFKRNP